MHQQKEDEAPSKWRNLWKVKDKHELCYFYLNYLSTNISQKDLYMYIPKEVPLSNNEKKDPEISQEQTHTHKQMQKGKSNKCNPEKNSLRFHQR